MADELPDAPWTKAPAQNQSVENIEAPWTRAAPDAAPAEEKPELTWGETGADVAKSAGIGVVKGGVGLAGLPGDLQSMADSSWNPFNKLAKQYEQAYPERAAQNRLNADQAGFGKTRLPTSHGIQSKIEETTGPFYKPKTTLGEYAQTAGEMLPNAAIGPGGIARRVGLNTILPAATSETAGQLTKDTAAEPYARLAGAVAAPLGASAVARGITPIPLAAERQALNQTLRNEGVTAQTAGQASGSKAVGYIESQLGDSPLAGGLATQAQDTSLRQFTQAALRRIGVNGEPTRQNLDQAVQAIQDTFTNVAARNTLRADRQFGHDIGTTLNGYENRYLSEFQRPIVNRIVDDITDHIVANNGTMGGQFYQSLRSRLSGMAHEAQSSATPDAGYATVLRGLRDSLDGAMSRSISPADRAQWAQARERWANWKTLEKVATNVDELGNVRITPTQLLRAAAARNNGQYSRGHSPFGALADAGKAVLTTLPNSGTASRSFVQGMTAALGGVFGSGAGPAGAMAGLAGGALVPGALGRAVMSPLAQRYLKNQAVGRVPFGSPQQIAGRGILSSPQVQEAMKTAEELDQ